MSTTVSIRASKSSAFDRFQSLTWRCGVRVAEWSDGKCLHHSGVHDSDDITKDTGFAWAEARLSKRESLGQFRTLI